MTCSLYAGTIAYHPGCGTGYSYYYNACCNVKWYVAWNVLLIIFAILAIVLSVIVIRRVNMKRKEKKKAHLIAHER